MNAPAHQTARTALPDSGAAAVLPAQDVPLRAIAGREQAVTFFEDLEGTISQLLELLDAETQLMRTGRIDESLALTAKKTALATSYARRVEILKANAEVLGRLIPVELERLRKRRESIETALKTNIAVLSAARAVSDALVKGVAGEVARKQSGPRVYGGGGTAAPAPRRTAAIAVDRAL
ncbi:MAG: hypothetical protein AB7L41_14810 [Flavobacteriaceae bacterium]